MGSEKNILLDSDKELAKQKRAFPPMCQSLLHHSMEQYELPGHTAPILRYALSISTTRRKKTGFSFSLLKRFFRHDIWNVFLRRFHFCKIISCREVLLDITVTWHPSSLIFVLGRTENAPERFLIFVPTFFKDQSLASQYIWNGRDERRARKDKASSVGTRNAEKEEEIFRFF